MLMLNPVLFILILKENKIDFLYFVDFEMKCFFIFYLRKIDENLKGDYLAFLIEFVKLFTRN